MTDVGAVAEAEQGVIEACVALADTGEVAVQPEGNAEARKQHGIELYVDRGAKCVCRPPYTYDQHIQQDFRTCSPDMREVELEEQVVQVRLVGRERGPAAQHPYRHHPYRIEHGYGQHRERERHESQIFVSGCFCRRAAVQAVDDEIGHDRSHQQRDAGCGAEQKRAAQDKAAGRRDGRRFRTKKRQNALFGLPQAGMLLAMGVFVNQKNFGMCYSYFGI